ncbi:hypothetical protein [Streptomyces buecherae]|uniref:hypothetical protein n=1 Tax=Streptomyces buecherae TaxID=2763006 RepID=UPI0036BF35FA
MDEPMSSAPAHPTQPHPTTADIPRLAGPTADPGAPGPASAVPGPAAAPATPTAVPAPGAAAPPAAPAEPHEAPPVQRRVQPGREPGQSPVGGREEAGGPGEETAPLGLVRTPTGDPTVDAGLERLGDLDHLPVDGHLEVYEDVHRGLRDVLDALDQRPGPGRLVPAPSPHDHRS